MTPGASGSASTSSASTPQSAVFARAKSSRKGSLSTPAQTAPRRPAATRNPPNPHPISKYRRPRSAPRVSNKSISASPRRFVDNAKSSHIRRVASSVSQSAALRSFTFCDHSKYRIYSLVKPLPDPNRSSKNSNKSAPEVSLIVCTHNRADLLPRCILAARRQTLPASRCEIVAVDNASTDYTPAVLRALAAMNDGIRVRRVFCPIPGLSHARNAGARSAKSPILAYIDDDAIAQPDLLEKLLAAYRAFPEAGCVGGRIELTLPPSLPAWYSPLFAGYYSAYCPPYAALQPLSTLAEYPYGANVSFRKTALARAGYFRTALGRIGRDQAGGEELDAECRIARLGYEIVYQPEAVVNHIVLPSRLTWRHIERSARAAGGNWAYYEREGLQPPRALSRDWSECLAVWKNLRRAGPRSFEHSQFLFHRARLIAKLRSRLRLA